MSLEGPPPSRHISSAPVSITTAFRMLDTYLKNSERYAHLHPDSIVTPAGIIFSSHGGPTGGVVIHNLRRIGAGLRGEYMEPEATPEPEGEEADAGRGKKKFGGKKGGQKNRVADEQWQDVEEYQREEGYVEVGELGLRTNAVQEGGEEPGIQATGGAQEGKKRKKGERDEGGEGEGEAKLDKAARKKAKQEKNLQRKRENAKKKAAQAE